MDQQKEQQDKRRLVQRTIKWAPRPRKRKETSESDAAESGNGAGESKEGDHWDGDHQGGSEEPGQTHQNRRARASDGREFDPG